jgi:DNA-directed RNA polymerase specialized sigma24 family protein
MRCGACWWITRARTASSEERGIECPCWTSTGGAPEDLDVIALDAPLVRLAVIDRRQSRLVELRFFAGLTGDEIAPVLGVAPITVKRDWALAKAWLFRELRGEA